MRNNAKRFCFLCLTVDTQNIHFDLQINARTFLTTLLLPKLKAIQKHHESSFALKRFRIQPSDNLALLNSQITLRLT